MLHLHFLKNVVVRKARTRRRISQTIIAREESISIELAVMSSNISRKISIISNFCIDRYFSTHRHSCSEQVAIKIYVTLGKWERGNANKKGDTFIKRKRWADGRKIARDVNNIDTDAFCITQWRGVKIRMKILSTETRLETNFKTTSRFLLFPLSIPRRVVGFLALANVILH